MRALKKEPPRSPRALLDLMRSMLAGIGSSVEITLHGVPLDIFRLFVEHPEKTNERIYCSGRFEQTRSPERLRVFETVDIGTYGRKVQLFSVSRDATDDEIRMLTERGDVARMREDMS
jgi:hypothetical protein